MLDDLRETNAAADKLALTSFSNSQPRSACVDSNTSTDPLNTLDSKLAAVKIPQTALETSLLVNELVSSEESRTGTCGTSHHG